MAGREDQATTQAGRRMIYRGIEPQRTPLIWLAIGLIGVCVIGLVMRGPEPFILAALVFSPLAVFGYYLFVIWGQRRIRRVDLDGGDLVIRAGFEKERRIALAGLDGWALQNIDLYTAGGTYDATRQVQMDSGLAIKGLALTACETATGKRIELVVQGAEIDTEAMRSFAPAAMAELEKRRKSRGKAAVSFKEMKDGR